MRPERYPAAQSGIISEFINRTKILFSMMDSAYAEASAACGFVCSGCADSCCEDMFFHYTLAEQFYLIEGLYSLSDIESAAIFEKSEEAMRRYEARDQKSSSIRVMCPLNTRGRCRLYEFRPMICRLHGIPHMIRKGESREQKFPGCGEFEKETEIGGHPADYVFDRTALYREMAALEIELRKALSFRGHFRKTVAEIIMDFRDGNIPGLEDMAQ